MRCFEITLVTEDDSLISLIFSSGCSCGDCLSNLLVEFPNLDLKMIDSIVEIK